jgi:hypothetical protein
MSAAKFMGRPITNQIAPRAQALRDRIGKPIGRLKKSYENIGRKQTQKGEKK